MDDLEHRAGKHLFIFSVCFHEQSLLQLQGTQATNGVRLQLLICYALQSLSHLFQGLNFLTLPKSQISTLCRQISQSGHPKLQVASISHRCTVKPK